MASIALRSLVLASSLVLALPPGWCSFLAWPALCRGEEACKQKHGGCCDVGHCTKREKPPPRPVPPCRCCCYELDWIKPSSPERFEADVSLVAFVAALDDVPACCVPRHGAELSIPGPSPPLHVLQCVWLC